jgi:hypothetical protein
LRLEDALQKIRANIGVSKAIARQPYGEVKPDVTVIFRRKVFFDTRSR